MALIVKSTRERVVKLFIATVLCLGLAAWCWYDAFYKESMKESSRQFNLYAIPVLIVLAVVGLFYALKAARLRIKADEQTGISVNSRPPIPWDAIEDIDTSILAKRGYLFVKYRDPQNNSVTLKLDEFNLDYFDELYAMIRSKLGLPAEPQPPDKSEPSPPPPTSS